MTSDSIDPFDGPVSRRPERDSARAHAAIDGIKIDAMLDRIDSVLRSRRQEETAAELPIRVSFDAELQILGRLRDLAEDLARLRALAEDGCDPEVAAFARETRARAERLICRKPRVDQPASGAIEIEMDYQRLHDFMLDPDFNRIAG